MPLIGATRSHDLQDQVAPADHFEISVRRTNIIKLVRLNSVGGAHPPVFVSVKRNHSLMRSFKNALRPVTFQISKNALDSFSNTTYQNRQVASTVLLRRVRRSCQDALYNWQYNQVHRYLDDKIAKEIAENDGGTVWSNRKHKLKRCIAQKIA